MTATLDRPVPRVGDKQRPQLAGRSPLWPGLLAASWAVAAGLVILGLPVLLTWATDSRSGSGAAAATRTVGQLWLVAHGAALRVPRGIIGITPLGLTLVPLALLHRAGRHGARTLEVASLAQAIRLVVAVAFPYAVAAAVLAAVSATHQVRPAPVQAMLGGLLVGVVGSASGILRESGAGSTALDLLPGRVRRVARPLAAVVAVQLAAGSLLAGLSLVKHFGRATSLASATNPGLAGGIALLLLGIVCVPNAVVWSSAWLSGPGFAVGTGTAVTPFTTTLGAVPALPLLAALPSSPPPTWFAVVALAVPVGSGIAGGVLLGRRLSCGPARAAGEGLLLGPAAAMVMAALAYLSGGPLGGGRLTEVGPSAWRIAVAVLVEVGLPAAAGAAVVRWTRTRRD